MASGELLRRPFVLERTESVPTDATVRHVDQLDTETLESFYETLEGDGSTLDATVDLEVGEIIVFTDYYRVVSA